jgi:nicotinamide-nucleotide amidase
VYCLRGFGIVCSRVGLEIEAGEAIMKSSEGELGYCIERELAGHAQPVIDALRAAGLSVATAESCTAGLIAAILSHAQNASDCLHGGFVAYTKASKAKVLGVDRSLLNAQGAVSAEVARQMAERALLRSPANIAVSVTGVLGPDPDEDGNPAGLVYFAVCREGHEAVVSRQDFSQLEPDDVRRAAVLHALELLQRSAN